MNLTLEGRAKTLPDIQRNWMWELVIPAIADVTTDEMGVEDLVIRCRTAVIPARGNEPIESQFMGMKQFFPGKPTFNNTFDVTIEETEDQKVLRAITRWQDLIFQTSPTDPFGGSSQRPIKRDLAKDIYLVMYKYNQEELTNKIRFFNAFPQNVADVPMDYATQAAVQYSVTFQFDFWRLA